MNGNTQVKQGTVLIKRLRAEWCIFGPTSTVGLGVKVFSQVSQLRNKPGASKGVLTCWESPDGAQASKIFLKRGNVLGRVDDTSCIYHFNS